jgi:hypothetical protein
MFADGSIPPSGFFDNFHTYIEFNELSGSCETEEEFYEEAKAREMTMDDLVKCRFFDESIEHVGNRVLFTTAKGYGGLGPQGLKNGDRVFLFLGASTPFIIRGKYSAEETENEGAACREGMFLLVGECYIHGLMGGEGLKIGDVQDITLC